MMLKWLILLLLALTPLPSNASLLDIKISPAQIFDVQWNISGDTFNASNFTRPFYSVSPNGSSCSWCQMTTAQVQSVFDNNQYFSFFDSTTDPGTYGLAVYNADGSVAWVLHNTGSIRALSTDVVFYNGNNFWGTVISVTEGFSYGDSKSWTVTNYPSEEEIDNYDPGTTEPLSEGETATGGSSAPPEPVFSSGITSQQSSRRASALTGIQGHSANVTITGDSNLVNIEQAGDGHYLVTNITGSNNTADIVQQSTATGTHHYLETGITGDSNNLDVLQDSTANNTAFVTVDGDNNTALVQQSGSGEHYLDLDITGNNHSADVIQQGSGNHSATVHLDGTQPWTFSLDQNSATDQTYSLPHAMTDNSAVSGTCSAIGGCNLTVTQQ